MFRYPFSMVSKIVLTSSRRAMRTCFWNITQMRKHRGWRTIVIPDISSETVLRGGSGSRSCCNRFVTSFVKSVRSDARCGSLMYSFSLDTDLDSSLSLGVDNRKELLVAWPLVLAHLLLFIDTAQFHPRVQHDVCSRMPCHDVRSSLDMGLHLDMELGSRSFIFKSSAASVPTNQKS
jgi:hypothetical protein